MNDDEALTAERVSLCSLYAGRGVVPSRGSFCCPLHTDCAGISGPLITGTWAYVGTGFGRATINGQSVRILFVAMDRGGYEGADVEAFADAQREFRSGAFAPTNPHMGGVHLLMRALVDEKSPEVYSLQFALTNAVKCARATDRMETRVTGTMVQNCRGHLAAEIDLLAPDLIITQGTHPAITCKTLLGELALIARFKGDVRGTAELYRNHHTILLTTPHPARLKGLRWRQGRLPEFLVNAATRVRHEFGGPSPTEQRARGQL